MLFWLPIHLGRYTLYIHFMRYGTITHAVIRSPGRLGRMLLRIPWLPIMGDEYWETVQHATHLCTLAFPLPFRELNIEIYRHQSGAVADD